MDVQNNNEHPEFKIGVLVLRCFLKMINIQFAMNLILVVKNLENTTQWTCIIETLR